MGEPGKTPYYSDECGGQPFVIGPEFCIPVSGHAVSCEIARWLNSGDKTLLLFARLASDEINWAKRNLESLQKKYDALHEEYWGAKRRITQLEEERNNLARIIADLDIRNAILAAKAVEGGGK